MKARARLLLFLGCGWLACATPGPASPPPIEEGADAATIEGADGPAADAPRGRPADAALGTEPDVEPAPAADAAPAADTAGGTDSAGSAGEQSAGCAVAGGLPDGEATITVGGMNRTYRLYLPTGYGNQRAWPLVLALHPNGGSGIGYWDGSARPIRKLAADKAIVVLPLARPEGGGWDWRGNLPADLAFFDALLDRLKGKLCVDLRRIFSLGFSGGASFSGVLGCMRKDIRAIAAGSGVAYYDPKACVGTPAAWITIGDDEAIAGRLSFRDFWRTRNGCQATTTPTDPAGCVAYGCPAEAPVQFCRHPGGHTWPDFGTAAAWAFFSRF